MYIRADYEQRGCNHHDNHSEVKASLLQPSNENSPYKSFSASHVVSEYSPYRSSSMNNGANSSHHPQIQGSPNASPCKVRMPNGETRQMTVEEMKLKFLQFVNTSIAVRTQFDLEEDQHRRGPLQGTSHDGSNLQMHWINREEEWYFTNKRLIFSTSSEEITDEWIEKLNSLIAQASRLRVWSQ